MNRVVTVVSAMFVLLVSAAAPALAEMPPGEHKSIGLGFHEIDAPVGLRWWFGGQKVGVDLGVGYQSVESTDYPDENLKGWAIDIGVPLMLKSWHRMHVILRPGLLYESDDVELTSPPTPFDTDDETTLSLTAEIEAEVFLWDNFSVSASHGIGYARFEPAGGGEEETFFGTFGRNFSHLGFHVYLFGDQH